MFYEFGAEIDMARYWSRKDLSPVQAKVAWGHPQADLVLTLLTLTLLILTVPKTGRSQ